jgi:hypothetical protein
MHEPFRSFGGANNNSERLCDIFIFLEFFQFPSLVAPTAHKDGHLRARFIPRRRQRV